MAGIIGDAMTPPQETPVNLIGLDHKPMSVLPSDLANMSHSDLYTLRDHNTGNYAAQQLLAPYEHQAFAREAVANNPLMSIPIAAAIPAYSAAKALGYGSGDIDTTAPSFSEMGAGLKGIGQGLITGITNLGQKISN